MAELIEVKRKGHVVEVLVDGVPIPADAIGRESVYYGLDPDSLPTLSLELLANRIVIDDDMKGTDVED